MASIPTILCGRDPKMVEFMRKSLAPKIDIIHVCPSTEAAISDIPRLLNGETVEATSNGADAALVVIGGLYSPEDVQKIKAAVDPVKELAYLVADTSKRPPGAAGPPPPELVKTRILASVAANEKADGQLEPGIHLF